MLCAKFGWNWLSGSREEDFQIISPRKSAGPFIWNDLNLLHPRMHCAKCCWNWPSGSWEEVFFKILSVFLLFRNYLPTELAIFLLIHEHVLGPTYKNNITVYLIFHLGRHAFRLTTSMDQNQRSAPARSDKSIGLCTATIQPPAQGNFVALTIAVVDFKTKCNVHNCLSSDFINDYKIWFC